MLRLAYRKALTVWEEGSYQANGRTIWIRTKRPLHPGHYLIQVIEMKRLIAASASMSLL